MRVPVISTTPGMQGKHVCQFGKMCYRKNPVHFEEYSHPELERIVLRGRNAKNEYDIPDDILAPADDTKNQLNMIEKVLKKNLGSLPVPVAAGPSSSGTPKRNTPSTSTASSSNNTPKRPFHSLAGRESTSKTKVENKSNPDVTVILDSEDEDDEDKFNADLALAIELSKRPKLDTPKREIVEKIKEEKTKDKITQKAAAVVVNDKESEKANAITPSKPSTSNWLSRASNKQPPTAAAAAASSSSSSTNPTTPRRPLPPTTSSLSTPTTSRLESKPKSTPTAPRLVANDLSVERRMEDYIDVIYPKGEAIKKYEASHPYNFFLTAIVDSPPTHQETLSITMQELLDTSLGDLESSVQINFMVDIGWLLAHYYFAGHLAKPLLILYGDETPELLQISSIRPNVTAIKIQMGHPFATHHSKVMLLGYADKSLRVIVSTANLYEDDWRNRTQGIWISPRCYEMDGEGGSARGESVTGFRADLIRYLNKYNQPRLQEWTARIQRTNFEAIKVFLICSAPDSHQTLQNDPKWGHLRMGHVLSKHAAPVADNCPLIAQSSSIGSLGRDASQWTHEISTSFCKDSGPPRLKRGAAFKMIFPSYNNVLAGHDGLLSGGGLPYRREGHMKQRWLESHLQLWKANERHRTKAMPHIKSYFRYSAEDGLYWFCLTSANFSRAAWGSVNKGSLGQVLRISNYEVGVLFLPRVMIDRSTFPLKGKKNGDIPEFPLPYDLPLVPYSIDDTPFFSDYLMSALRGQ